MKVRTSVGKLYRLGLLKITLQLINEAFVIIKSDSRVTNDETARFVEGVGDLNVTA
jgi:hypothetical protein